MAAYCVAADIDQVFGTSNVTKWADLDSDGSATKIANRKTAAIAYASEHLDDVLRVSPYASAYKNASGTQSPTITDLTAKLAGLWLYEARGSKDFNEKTGRVYHRYAFLKREVEATLAAIRNGELKLNAL